MKKTDLQLIVNEDMVEPNLKIGGNPPADNDWLSGMKCGTEFLCSPKRYPGNWIFTKFLHGGMLNGNVLIIPMKGDEPIQDPSEWVWTKGDRFCRFWELMGVLLIPKD